MLVMINCFPHSDRVSSFDRDIGVVPGKGHVLADMTSWWFNRTRDIVPTILLVKKMVIFSLKMHTDSY